MANEPKMKIGIGADTGDFDKGAKKVKQEMKDLSKVSSDAFGAIGNALGVDTRQVQQFSSALQGLGAKFGQTGQAGTSAFGAIAKAITPVTAGIAGLGLAAAIAAFKALNAEADAFERTIQGGVIAKQTEAYTTTMRQAIRDQQNIGQQASSWRQDLKVAWANLAGWAQSGFSTDKTLAAIDAGNRAKEIATELYNLDLKRKEVSVQISELDAQIAQKREVISDTTRNAGERAKALADAQELIKQKMDLQLPLAEKQRDLLIEYNGLASTTIKDYDAEIAAKINVNNLIQQEAAEQRGLLRQQKQINAELQKTVDLNEEVVRQDLSMPGLQHSISNPGASVQVPVGLAVDPEYIEYYKKVISASLGDMTIYIGFEADMGKLLDISREVESVISNIATSAGEAIGQLIGDLATGGDAWANFGNAALSAFGDMAITVGKIAIEMGMASEGIKAALSLDNPYVAIAAGVALVALGTAVKAGLSNVANGNYSASSSVASGNYSAGPNDYATKEVSVNVTGTLVAQGSQLVAVLNNENNRKRNTT